MSSTQQNMHKHMHVDTLYQCIHHSHVHTYIHTTVVCTHTHTHARTHTSCKDFKPLLKNSVAISAISNLTVISKRSVVWAGGHGHAIAENTRDTLTIRTSMPPDPLPCSMVVPLGTDYILSHSSHSTTPHPLCPAPLPGIRGVVSSLPSSEI